MSVNTRNSIVTNGLVFYVDALNPRSYTSGSTVWNSIVDTTTSASLTNVSFDANKKCLVFSSSSNSTCIFNNSDLFNFNTGSFTIEVVVRLTATASGTVNSLYQKRSTTTGIGTNKGYSYRVLNNTITDASTIISVDNGSGNANNTTYIGPLLPYYNYIYSSLIFNVNILKLTEYRSGILNNTTNTGVMTGSFYNNSSNFTIGKIEGNSLDAEYYLIRAYNRVLSQQEVLQNYNATKARYNLT